MSCGRLFGAKEVRITIDGMTFVVRAGDTVAAALLASGLVACRRTPVTGARRRVLHDGRVLRWSCHRRRPAESVGSLINVEPGMRVVTGGHDHVGRRQGRLHERAGGGCDDILDVAIVGAGPLGAAATLCADRGLSTPLYDEQAHPADRSIAAITVSPLACL